MLTFHKWLLALFLLRQSLVNCGQLDDWVKTPLQQNLFVFIFLMLYQCKLRIQDSD